MFRLFAKRTKSKDECNCPCHDKGRVIMHCIPCCYKCDKCKKNIKLITYDEHVKSCKGEDK